MDAPPPLNLIAPSPALESADTPFPPSTPKKQLDISAEEHDEFLPLHSPPASLPSTPHSPYARKSTHARTHSRSGSISLAGSTARLHQKNLSIYFPRPENKGSPSPSALNEPDPVEISRLTPTKGWGAAAATSRASPATPAREEASATRRGHHHRHSLSHNFFSFLDPTASPKSPLRSPAVTDKATPKPVPQSFSVHHRRSTSASLPSSAKLHSKYAHLPSFLRFGLAVCFHIPLSTQLKLLLCSFDMCIGALLWIAGQAGESLSVTGLGYLVVFDALGAFSSVLVEGRATGVTRLWEIYASSLKSSSSNDVRYPFGKHRSATLSHFTQCVYLLFSAVYVLKESVEHVLLLHGPVEEVLEGDGHGFGHGGMGHGEVASKPNVVHLQESVQFPPMLLLASCIVCLATALVLKNHSTMSEATGLTSSVKPKSIILRYLNPFSTVSLLFALTLCISAFLLPTAQLAPLDKVIALLQSLTMFWIAYPAARITGGVLLMTAPESHSARMRAAKRAIEDIQQHPSVVRISPPHIWQLTPTPPLPPPTSSKNSRLSVIRPSSDSVKAITILTIQIYVKPGVGDQEILEVTKMARSKLDVWKVGGGDGEITVQVKRDSGDDDHHSLVSHDHHDHDHNHSASHSDSHSHSHAAPTHSHSHSHDHSHSHSGHSHSHHH